MSRYLSRKDRTGIRPGELDLFSSGFIGLQDIEHQELPSATEKMRELMERQVDAVHDRSQNPTKARSVHREGGRDRKKKKEGEDGCQA